MFLMVERPDELFTEAEIPAVMTGPGVRLEAVEDVPAGPWLAALLDEVDPRKLSEWDLPAYLRACARMQAWAAARLSEGVTELASRPGGFGADKEVALALREPVGAAQRRIHQANRLARMLPTTRRLFRWGDINEKQAEALVEATSRVDDPELAVAIEDKVLTAPRAPAPTARELARPAPQALTRPDPDGAEARARAAREDTDVVLHPGEDGMAATVIEAPVEQAVIVKTAADTYAASCKAAGDNRKIGVLRSEGLARICADYLAGRSPAHAGSAPRAGGLPVEIGIVVGVDTALGRRRLPGEVPGLGIVPREVIARMISTESARLRLLVVDDTGRLVHRAVDAYRPTSAQIAQIRDEFVFSVGPG